MFFSWICTTFSRAGSDFGMNLHFIIKGCDFLAWICTTLSRAVFFYHDFALPYQGPGHVLLAWIWNKSSRAVFFHKSAIPYQDQALFLAWICTNLSRAVNFLAWICTTLSRAELELLNNNQMLAINKIFNFLAKAIVFSQAIRILF